MEANKDNFSIADYSVSQTTLDQVFINFAKSSYDTDEDDEDEESEDNENYEEELDYEQDNMNRKEFENELNQVKVNLPPLNVNVVANNPLDNNNLNDTPTFESIKEHFNSLKKSKHIRKTSSAKSQDFKQSQRSRKSLKSRGSSKKRRSSNQETDAGFTNLAYEIEYKNSEECELPIQDYLQDITCSITEEGDFFSKF